MLREFEHGLPQDGNSTHALPSHVKYPSRTMRKLHIPIPTHTATNSKTNATHYGHVQIQTSNNATMTLPAVANPVLKKNLLSFNDIARQWGEVTFYAKWAAIYNTLHPSLPQCIGTATLRQGMYILYKPRKPTRAPTVSFSSRAAPSHLRSRHRRSCKVSTPIDSVHSPNSGGRQPPKQN